MLKILVVSYDDDNFGDNLIRICFESLLKVVLTNLRLPNSAYCIKRMPLKKIEPELITGADIIAFAGGGLFGLSYLGFYDYLDQITRIAEENGIPVVFSSIGVNNMDASGDLEDSLKNLLKRGCIAAVSVRENIDLFKQYAKGCTFSPELVCDPAVWTKFVYSLPDSEHGNIIGINVVRGGLFKDNGKSWGMKDELIFLDHLRKYLEEAGQDYRFYTNGSVFDNNTLHYFEREYKLPRGKCIYPHTTKEVVQTVSSFEAVITFRMHSAIIAYSYGIPSVSMVWNDKIPYFYKNIGHSDRAFEFRDWDSRLIYEKINSILETKPAQEDKDEEYLMSLYRFLYRIFGAYVKGRNQAAGKPDPVYPYKTVIRMLETASADIDEECYDLHLKLEKAEKHYLERFTDLRKKNQELKNQKEALLICEKELEELKEENEVLRLKISQTERELQKINSWLSVRFVRRVRGGYRKIVPVRIRKALRKVIKRH